MEKNCIMSKISIYPQKTSTANADEVLIIDSVTGSNRKVTLENIIPDGGITQINDASGNEEVKFVSTASAVNEVTVTNNATGSAPALSATGDDTDIDLNLVTKGTGLVMANGLPVMPVVAIGDAAYAFEGTDGETALPGYSLTIDVPEGSPDLMIEAHTRVEFISTNAAFGFHAYIRKDAANVGNYTNNFCGVASVTNPKSYVFGYKDEAVAAGSHTYSLRVAAAGSTTADENFLQGFIKAYYVQ